MLQTSTIKAKLFWILRSLRRSAVDHEDIGYLIELDVESKRLCLHEVNVTLAHQVSIPFIGLLTEELRD